MSSAAYQIVDTNDDLKVIRKGQSGKVCLVHTELIYYKREAKNLVTFSNFTDIYSAFWEHFASFMYCIQ